jgi:hypothetical protein
MDMAAASRPSKTSPLRQGDFSRNYSNLVLAALPARIVVLDRIVWLSFSTSRLLYGSKPLCVSVVYVTRYAAAAAAAAAAAILTGSR